MKTLLNNKANSNVLENFLSALLEDDNIQTLNILETEPNIVGKTDYSENLLYATSKIIIEHQELGENFKDTSKVIFISILYFNLGITDDYIYYETTDLKKFNIENQLIVEKSIKIAETLAHKYKFIEKKIFLEYYLIPVERYKNIVQKQQIDKWIYINKNNERKEELRLKEIKQNEILHKYNISEAERKRNDKYL
ncbi:MAG: hypothetical protein SNJ71_00715 [Bacteroidales bacterium]